MKLGRRLWLKKIAGVLASITLSGASVWGVFRFLNYRVVLPNKKIKVNKKKVPAHGALLFKKEGVALVSSAQAASGVVALSLRCPHLGCQVATDAQGFICPCHGSRFSPEGELLKGPSTQPLVPVKVSDQGEFWEMEFS